MSRNRISRIEHSTRILRSSHLVELGNQLDSRIRVERVNPIGLKLDPTITLVVLLEHVVKIWEKLIKDYFSWLASQYAFVNAYKTNKQVNKIVALLEHVVKIWEKLIKDYFFRLASQHAFASAY
jgi:hypothetical protein